MNSFENGRPRLELVRTPEDEPDDIKAIEAYCDELLWDNNGQPREAHFEQTQFRSLQSEWSRAIFRRDKNGYLISCYEREGLSNVVFEISLQPYRDVFPGQRPPRGVEWYYHAGKPNDVSPSAATYDPGDFRGWLESLWGILPDATRRRAGLLPRRPGSRHL